MKAKIRFSILLAFLFTAGIIHAQELKKTDDATKAQDHNSTRSNKTASSVAPDNSGGNGEPNVSKANHNTARSNKNTVADPGKGESVDKSESSKKGYDYYQSKSDLKSTGSSTKAQDHNSTRSNKTANSVAPDNQPNGENSNKKEISPSEKTDKSEAESAKKKSN